MRFRGGAFRLGPPRSRRDSDQARPGLRAENGSFRRGGRGESDAGAIETGAQSPAALSRVRLLIADEARDDAGGTATKTVVRTLR